MLICRWSVVGLMVLAIISAPVRAEDNHSSKLPWKTAYFNAGYYVVSLDSGFRVGSGALGLGIDLSVEDFLGLKSTDSAFRIDGGWRFTENKRHKLEFSWFRFNRDGNTDIAAGAEIELPDGEGGTTVIGPGRLESVFNFDIIKAKYEYSFLLDDRLDFNGGIGLYVMPIEFGITGTVDGIGQTRIFEDITAPLPVFGLGFDFVITPEWVLRQQIDGFYLKLGDFQGGIISNSIALEYFPWEHAGFGVSADQLLISIEAERNDWPGIDFVGTVDFNYFGALLYLKVFI